MKKNHFLFLLMLLVCLNIMAGRKIDIHQTGQVPPRVDVSIPADQPEVYYDSNTQEIIVDGDDDGFVSYYDVEIYPSASAVPVISTQIDGDYDAIDVSSLSVGDYTIIIYSPYNHEFEGEFTIE